MYDPYGYYKARNVYSVDKDPNVPFYEDYPVNDTKWEIGAHYVNLSRLPIPNALIDERLDDLTIVEKSKQKDLFSEAWERLDK